MIYRMIIRKWEWISEQRKVLQLAGWRCRKYQWERLDISLSLFISGKLLANGLLTGYLHTSRRKTRPGWRNNTHQGLERQCGGRQQIRELDRYLLSSVSFSTTCSMRYMPTALCWKTTILASVKEIPIFSLISFCHSDILVVKALWWKLRETMAVISVCLKVSRPVQVQAHLDKPAQTDFHGKSASYMYLQGRQWLLNSENCWQDICSPSSVCSLHTNDYTRCLPSEHD